MGRHKQVDHCCWFSSVQRVGNYASLAFLYYLLYDLPGVCEGRLVEGVEPSVLMIFNATQCGSGRAAHV